MFFLCSRKQGLRRLVAIPAFSIVWWEHRFATGLQVYGSTFVPEKGYDSYQYDIQSGKQGGKQLLGQPERWRICVD